jgi:enoyl-CoA hydratase
MGSIEFTSENGIAVVTVSSPEVKNALTPEMGRELVAICDTIDADPSLGAAVVRGADGVFCSGADTRRWLPGADQAEETTYAAMGALYESFVRVGRLKVPTVAAVRGMAVGAGLNLMLATDLRVVSRDARLLAGFARIGLHPGGGFFTLAVRTAGRELASAWGVFGQELSGAEAVSRGLAWDAVDDAEVDDAALALAAVPAADPALARATVSSFRIEAGPPGIGWDAAVNFERPSQMWSLRRRSV